MIFDDKYLIAYLCSSKKINDFMILLTFYRYLNNLVYKTKDVAIYQIKLQWLIDCIINNKQTGSKEIDDLFILTKKYVFLQKVIISLIETKNIDFDNFPFKSESALVDYIRDTDGMFWTIYARILDDNLEDRAIATINYAATAFGIVEFIKYTMFKKSKGIYPLIYGGDISGDIKIIEEQNIKSLLHLASTFINISKRTNLIGKAKRILYLNYASEYFIKQLIISSYDLSDKHVWNLPKSFYFKLIFLRLLK